MAAYAFLASKRMIRDNHRFLNLLMASQMEGKEVNKLLEKMEKEV